MTSEQPPRINHSEDDKKRFAEQQPVSEQSASMEGFESTAQNLAATRSVDASIDVVKGVVREVEPIKVGRQEEREMMLEKLADAHPLGFVEAIKSPNELAEKLYKRGFFTEEEFQNRTALNFVKDTIKNLEVARGLKPAISRHG